MNLVSYLNGTAPARVLVVQGVGRALNPTERSGKPLQTNLSAGNYDNITARHHMNGTIVPVNNMRVEAFTTPTRTTRKNSGWMTVSGGKDGLSVTFAPDAVVVYAVVVKDGAETVITNMLLSDYQNFYC
jgi:hypothetical protein